MFEHFFNQCLVFEVSVDVRPHFHVVVFYAFHTLVKLPFSELSSQTFGILQKSGSGRSLILLPLIELLSILNWTLATWKE